MKKVASILERTRNLKRPTNLSTEFQHFGVYIADTLDDPKHYSLYIKLAKEVNRGILEEALNYAKGSEKARSKARIFMWKLKELRKLEKEKNS